MLTPEYYGHMITFANANKTLSANGKRDIVRIFLTHLNFENL